MFSHSEQLEKENVFLGKAEKNEIKHFYGLHMSACMHHRKYILLNILNVCEIRV